MSKSPDELELELKEAELFPRVVRQILLIGNIVLFICGIAIIIIGNAYRNGAGSSFLGYLGIYMMFIGFAVTGMAIVGYIGAHVRVQIVMLVYLIIVWTMAIASFVGSGWILAGSGDQHVDSVVTNGWTSLDNVLKVGVQNQLDCCGLENIYDAGLPCPDDYVWEPTNEQTRCYDEIIDLYQKAYRIVGKSGIAFGVVLVSFAVLSSVRLRHMRWLEVDNSEEVHSASHGHTHTTMDPAVYPAGLEQEPSLY